jgi:hypothetical protein
MLSNSGTAVIAYVMATQKLTYAEAFAYVALRRPCVCPNTGTLIFSHFNILTYGMTGFEKQLVAYEELIRNA